MKIKGFDKDLKCRGFQFEIGKTYDTGAPDNKIKLCSKKVFHYCDSLVKVHRYYSVGKQYNNRFCEIEVLGAEVSDDEICGSNRIRIVREITGEELNILKGLINGNIGYFNSGNYNSGYRNSGDYNNGIFNSGDYNSGYRNSDSYNSGDYNSGNYNSGNGNSGDGNSNDNNSGNCNSGHHNSGDCNSGDYNSGMFNSCHHSSGFFCTKEPKVRIFDIETDMTVSEFRETKYYKILIKHPLRLTEWKNYSEAEMANDENKKLIGGYLEKYAYRQACQIWWEKYTADEKAIIMDMPNFDKEKFEYITGIDVTKI